MKKKAILQITVVTINPVKTHLLMLDSTIAARTAFGVFFARQSYACAALHYDGRGHPHANELTVDILAAVEDEVRRISARTKAALAAYKAREGQLGGSLPQCRNLTDAARRKGARAAAMAHVKNADEAYHDVTELMRELRDGGASLREIATELNAANFTTRRGKPWNAVQVARVLSRSNET